MSATAAAQMAGMFSRPLEVISESGTSVRVELPFKRLKGDAKQFTNEMVRNHALTSIKAIKAEHLQIEKEAAGVLADARRVNLVKRIDDVRERCLNFSELPKHASKSQARLKVCLDEALQPLESIKWRLTVEERKQEAEQQQFDFERASKKSQLLRNEQEEYYRCSLFGEFLHEIGQEYGGENRNPTIFLAYANPTASQHEHESWIPKFVARLQKLLVKSKFAHVENMHEVVPGEDRKAHIAKAETSDVVILFGSRSLCEGKNSDTSALMTHIEDNHTGRKFPILLHDALPAEFSGTSIDWRKKGFVKQFLKLFVALWGCPKECAADLLTRWDQKVAPMLNPGWYADQRKAIDACPDRAALKEIPVSRQVNTASPVVAAAGVTEKPLDERLIDRLREHYLTKSFLTLFSFRKEGEWKLEFPLDKFYCQLVMTSTEEQETGRDEPPHPNTIEIHPVEIFTCEKLRDAERKKAIIWGDAGMGKTTFTTMLLHRWAKQKLFQEFRAVFIVRLRNLSSNIYLGSEWDAYSILKKEHEALGLDFRALTEDQNFLDHSLLILDGWDELPDAAQEGGHLHAPFTALQQMFPHTLVTSRPGSFNCAKEADFRLTGFSPTQVNLYVQHYFDARKMPEKTAQLIQFLDRTSLARNLATVPINLSILCGLFLEDEAAFAEGAEFTLSSLYQQMLTQFYKSFLHRTGVHQNEWHLRHSFDTHPKVKNLISCLQRVAYEALTRGVLLLEREVLEPIVDDYHPSVDFTKLRNLGLFSIDGDQGSFIHRTFQEYFAAGYITSHPEIWEEVLSHRLEEGYLLPLQFVAERFASEESPTNYHHFLRALEEAKPEDETHEYQLWLRAVCHNAKPSDEFVLGLIGKLKEISPPERRARFLMNRPNILFSAPMEAHLVQGLSDNFDDTLILLNQLTNYGNALPKKVIEALLDLFFLEGAKKPFSPHQLYKASLLLQYSAPHWPQLEDTLLDKLAQIPADPSSWTSFSIIQARISYFSARRQVAELNTACAPLIAWHHEKRDEYVFIATLVSLALTGLCTSQEFRKTLVKILSTNDLRQIMGRPAMMTSTQIGPFEHVTDDLIGYACEPSNPPNNRTQALSNLAMIFDYRSGEPPPQVLKDLMKACLDSIVDEKSTEESVSTALLAMSSLLKKGASSPDRFFDELPKLTATGSLFWDESAPFQALCEFLENLVHSSDEAGRISAFRQLALLIEMTEEAGRALQSLRQYHPFPSETLRKVVAQAHRSDLDTKLRISAILVVLRCLEQGDQIDELHRDEIIDCVLKQPAAGEWLDRFHRLGEPFTNLVESKCSHDLSIFKPWLPEFFFPKDRPIPDRVKAHLVKALEAPLCVSSSAACQLADHPALLDSDTEASLLQFLRVIFSLQENFLLIPSRIKSIPFQFPEQAAKMFTDIFTSLSRSVNIRVRALQFLQELIRKKEVKVEPQLLEAIYNTKESDKQLKLESIKTRMAQIGKGEKLPDELALIAIPATQSIWDWSDIIEATKPVSKKLATFMVDSLLVDDWENPLFPGEIIPILMQNLSSEAFSELDYVIEQLTSKDTPTKQRSEAMLNAVPAQYLCDHYHTHRELVIKVCRATFRACGMHNGRPFVTH